MTDESGEADPTREMSASAVIARFGGIRPMAKKLDVAVTTVQGWKERGVIPAARHADVLRAAERHGIPLSPEDLHTASAVGEEDAAPPPWARAAAEAAEAEVDEAGARAVEPAAAEGEEEVAGERPPPAAPEAPRRRRAGRAVAAGLLIGILIAGAGAAAWWFWWAGPEALPWQRQAAEPAASAGEVAALSGRVEQLGNRVGTIAASIGRIEPRLAELERLPQRVAELEARGAGEPGLPPQVTDRLAAIDKLEKRLGDLEARREAAAAPQEVVERLQAVDALDSRLAALESRLSALEEAAPGEGLDRLRERVAALEARAAEEPAEPAGAPDSAALLIAVGQLRDAIRGSGPYAAELNAVRTLVPEKARLDEALAPLAARADQGLTTLATLRDRFPQVARAAVRAARLPEDARWYDKALYQVTSLATVRRTGEVAGDTPEALVARAELRLAKGDVAGAVEVLERLEGRPAEAAADWLAEARRRLAAERAVATLQAVALAGVRAQPETDSQGPQAPAPGGEAPAAPAAPAPPASEEAPAAQ